MRIAFTFVALLLIAALAQINTMLYVLPDRLATIREELLWNVAAQNRALIVSQNRLARVAERGRADLKTQLHEIDLTALAAAAALNARLIDTNRVLDAHLALANRTAAVAAMSFDRQLDAANTTLAETAAPLRAIGVKFDAQFMTCAGNPACLQSTMLAFKGEGLKTSDNFRRLTGDVSDWVHFQTRPLTRKQKVWRTTEGVLFLGARAYSAGR